MRTCELGAGGLSMGSVAAALLLPKCPVCVAALLSALGIGASIVDALAPVLRPAALALGLLLAVVLAALVARRTRRRCQDCVPTVDGR